ncbi:hypothetical protein KKE68_05575 [Patescibacteria group bacterium]|nr:hypothetical protein [Patescibacteria group bacterium]
MKKVKILKKNQIPKTYLTINNKHYRAINPQKALIIARRLSDGIGEYKVHVVYGKKQISPRKKETIENLGKYKSAKEAKNAILAFLNKDLWIASKN